jgi:hypothetical protein
MALVYIEDTNKQKLYYRFSPAAVSSNFIPLIVILNPQVTHFEYKMWNVLTPINNFEDEDSSSLHGKGDFLAKDLLEELINKIAEEYECEDHIYIYGTSIEAYKAILHGILCKANTVYVDALYPSSEDSAEHTIKEILDMFEKMTFQS